MNLLGSDEVSVSMAIPVSPRRRRLLSQKGRPWGGLSNSIGYGLTTATRLPARTRSGSSSGRGESGVEGGGDSHRYVTVSADIDSVNRGNRPWIRPGFPERSSVRYRLRREGYPLATDTDISYDEMPYDGGANSGSHPRRLATLGRVFGMDPAPPGRCRVLELGCSVGTNLIAMAYTLPHAQFVGMDLSESQIVEARRRAASIGLTNIRFEQADIMDFGANGETYDYILACGVFSWIPEPVRNRMMELCGTMLAPQGIAYMTYNIYPGWFMRQPLRDLMVMAAGDGPVATRVDRAVRMLDFMVRATKGDSGRKDETFRTIVLRERQILDKLPAEYIAHEHLESSNLPVYFKDFVQLATENGLQYLADSAISTMFPTELDAETSAELDAMTASQVGLEQLLDFIRGRQFRQSLLCRADVPLRRDMNAIDLDAMYLSATGGIVSEGDPAYAADAVKYRDGESVVRLGDPDLIHALKLVVEKAPGQVPYGELVPPDADDERLLRLKNTLIRMYLGGLIRFDVEPARFALEVPERPMASRAAVATRSREEVTNLLHQGVSLSPLASSLLEHLDGSRNRDGIAALLSEELAKVEEGSELRGLLDDPTLLLAEIDTTLRELVSFALIEEPGAE